MPHMTISIGVHLRRRLVRLVTYVLLVAIVGISFMPVLWTVATSIKPLEDAISIPPVWIPRRLGFQGYARLWREQQDFPRWFLNSLIVAGGTTVLSVILSSMAAYVFSRFRYRWTDAAMTIILMAQMFPLVLILISIFIVMKNLHLLNTYIALIISYTSFTLPFCIWNLKNFFDMIPSEVTDASLVDGASHFQVFTKIMLPLTAPGIVSTALFGFLVGWDEFLMALTLTSTDSMRTLPVGLSKFVGQYTIQWDSLTAGSVLAILPPLILFVSLQKYFVRGLTSGAMKG